MAYFQFLWIDRVVDKLNDRHIRIADVEDIICHPVDDDISESSGRPIAFGYTADGRYIAVIYDEIDEINVQPITAYDVPEPRGERR